MPPVRADSPVLRCRCETIELAGSRRKGELAHRRWCREEFGASPYEIGHSMDTCVSLDSPSRAVSLTPGVCLRPIR